MPDAERVQGGKGKGNCSKGAKIVVSGLRDCTPDKDRLWHKVAVVDTGPAHESQLMELRGGESCGRLNSPMEDTWGAVGAFVGGALVVCREKCLVYDEFSGKWGQRKGLDLSEGRVGAAAIVLEEDKWWVAGGRSDGGSVLASTEVLDATKWNPSFSSFVSLPREREWHSLVRVGHSSFMLLCGKPLSREDVWIFDYRERAWAKQERMREARYAAAVGIYQDDANEDAMVVVAGGLGYVSGDNTNWVGSVEGFDVGRRRWVRGGGAGKDATTTTFSHAASLQVDGGTFVAMGGMSPEVGGAADKRVRRVKRVRVGVDQHGEESCQVEWEEVEGMAMKEGRAGFVAVLVPTNFAC